MSDWHEALLGDVLTLQRGYDLTEKEASPGPFPVISSGGVSYTTDVPKVDGPGVVTGRKGVLGKVHFSAGPYWPHDTTLWVKDFKGSNPRFVYYFLQTLPLATLDAGASNPTLNRNHAHLLPVRVPPSEVQERIARVLGAIDDLIENNRRRVEVLEEMARAIYREWFVHFRYPGHEYIPLVDSPLGPIPDGWEVQPFSELASFVNGFAFKPAHWGDSGRPIIKIKQLKQGVTPDTPRCDPDSIAAKYWIEPGDLLFSWSADLGVYRWSDEPGLLNQHLFVVTPDGRSSVAYLHHALDGAMPQFWDRAQGTTMRHIKRSALSEVTTGLPPHGLIRQFTEVVDPIDHVASVLDQETRNLAGLRDLVLPKLVAGQIDVSRLDLDELAEVASA